MIEYSYLQNAKDISLILEAFKDKDGLKASSKVKYINSLRSMLAFLKDDFQSSEFEDNLSSDDILFLQQKQKSVYQEFDCILEFLSNKGAWIHQPQEKRPRKIKFRIKS